MKLCNDTITVYNRYTDATTKSKVWVPTVIKGVHWFGRCKVAVSQTGLMGADEYIIRIPDDADFGNKSFLTPKEYYSTQNKTNYFTLANGDIIVRGSAVETGKDRNYLFEKYEDIIEIISVTDDRAVPNAPHWRVTGK